MRTPANPPAAASERMSGEFTLRRAGRILLVLAIVLTGVLVVGRTFQDTRPLSYITVAPWQEAGRDHFSGMARRYVPLQPWLHGVESVGWISSYDHESGQRMMAQSMLAPTLVVDSDTPGILIASFEDDARLDAFLGTRNYQVQRRFGAGVAIVQRGRP